MLWITILVLAQFFVDSAKDSRLKKHVLFEHLT